ncbi:MAG TPA: hypothetical protein VJU79_00925, partial [Candidatus Dormibacteraeota bacterium]|nr:hypothetical protein [Candidatus Dormibacteraeota bacterium]
MTDSAFTLPIRLLEEAAHVVSEFVPPAAQKHLLNAQREMLRALTVTIEHNSARNATKPRSTGAKTQRRKP